METLARRLSVKDLMAAPVADDMVADFQEVALNLATVAPMETTFVNGSEDDALTNALLAKESTTKSQVAALSLVLSAARVRVADCARRMLME